MPLGATRETHLNEDYLTGADLPNGVYPVEDGEGGDMEGLLEGRMSTKLRDGVISREINQNAIDEVTDEENILPCNDDDEDLTNLPAQVQALYAQDQIENDLDEP